MAKITYVEHAQQRYATVPVLDDNGEPKRTPVINKRTGEQKRTRRGNRPVFMTVTRQDRSQPLSMPRCDYPGCKHPQREIQPGEPYKHISPKSGPYGGRTLSRHRDCPGWNVWDYSSSLSARTAEIENDFVTAIASAETEDDVRSALDEAAEAVRGLAEEKRESAQNIEDGFGHPTSSSEELTEVADGLESWADEIEGTDIPELPEPDEDAECEACGGTGKEDGREEDTDAADCGDCEGTGHPQEPTEEQIDEWRSELDGILPDQPF